MFAAAIPVGHGGSQPCCRMCKYPEPDVRMQCGCLLHAVSRVAAVFFFVDIEYPSYQIAQRIKSYSEKSSDEHWVVEFSLFCTTISF